MMRCESPDCGEYGKPKDVAPTAGGRVVCGGCFTDMAEVVKVPKPRSKRSRTP